jgi:hypothetical protein
MPVDATTSSAGTAASGAHSAPAANPRKTSRPCTQRRGPSQGMHALVPPRRQARKPQGQTGSKYPIVHVKQDQAPKPQGRALASAAAQRIDEAAARESATERMAARVKVSSLLLGTN